MVYHEDSAKIVSKAIAYLGEGNRGLAERLNKNPSLISRYASGGVRPKAETLLECLKIIGQTDVVTKSSSEKEHAYESIKKAVNQLSPIKDDVLINALLSILALAKKV